jgi:hypothetical protein
LQHLSKHQKGVQQWGLGNMAEPSREMQFLFLSNGNETIYLINSGIPLSDSAFREIEKTFKFN